MAYGPVGAKLHITSWLTHTVDASTNPYQRTVDAGARDARHCKQRVWIYCANGAQAVHRLVFHCN